MRERFTCDRCSRSFTKAWTDTEAHEESEQFFGYEIPESEQRQLCDECWAEFTQWVDTLTPEERAELDRQTLNAQ